MTDAVDTTQWSLPGPADMPRDDAPDTAGGLQGDHPPAGLRERLHLGAGPSRRTPSPTCSPSTWGSPRGSCPRRPCGGARARPGRWWPSGGRRRSGPVALQREAFKPPARLRLPMPGLVFVCSPGRPPWVYAALSRPTDPEQHLFRAPAFNVFRDGRVCPGSHRFPEEVGLIPESFFQSYFSLTGDSRDRSKKHADNLQALWEEIDGQTEYPVEDLVPQCTVAQAMAVSEGRRGYH